MMKDLGYYMNFVAFIQGYVSVQIDMSIPSKLIANSFGTRVKLNEQIVIKLGLL